MTFSLKLPVNAFAFHVLRKKVVLVCGLHPTVHKLLPAVYGDQEVPRIKSRCPLYKVCALNLQVSLALVPKWEKKIFTSLNEGAGLLQ